ncbi:MAG: alpha/beta fold hydrolase [Gemmatimonadota bacterium]|nr:alpha/beta fold hydrolase [Gemmatimonadota bacterium]
MILSLLALALALLAWNLVGRWIAERRTASRLTVDARGEIIGAAAIGLPDGARGTVLMLHGFGDTPQTLVYLANDLHRRGYAVYAPLLPGHGRSLREFARSSADQWTAAAEEAYSALRARGERVSVVGLSMGGALAASLASRHPEVPALVLLAPYLRNPPLVRRIALFPGIVGLLAPYLSGGSDRSIQDEAERARSLAYRATTPKLLAELGRIAAAGRASLPSLRMPTLLIQSREDNRIDASVAEEAFSAIGAREKQLEWLDGCGHVITVDRGRDRVLQMVAEWLEAHAGAATEGRRTEGSGTS